LRTSSSLGWAMVSPLSRAGTQASSSGLAPCRSTRRAPAQLLHRSVATDKLVDRRTLAPHWQGGLGFLSNRGPAILHFFIAPAPTRVNDREARALANRRAVRGDACTG